MQIKIENLHNTYKISYIDFDLDFQHFITVPDNKKIERSDFFRLAIFARPKNSNFYTILGTSIDERHKSDIEKNLKCEVRAYTHPSRAFKGNIEAMPSDSYLCFSGGFDSVAANYLLGESSKLISIDFSGEFSREATFFKKFNPINFKWTLRGKQPHNKIIFNENLDWRFLIAPATLLQKENPVCILTGTILEASPFWFSGQKRADFSTYSQSTLGTGATVIGPVSSISEYGTTLIANYCLSKDELEESLTSLAAPQSFKLYRKKVLLSIINQDNLPKRPEIIKKHFFGSSFGEDIVALYVAWKIGGEWAKKNYVDNLPDGWGEIDMQYFERINIENMKLIDCKFRDFLVGRMKDLGLSFCDNDDLNNIEKTKNFIARFHAATP